MGKTIEKIITKYYDEAYMVSKVPSDLNRGEGTETEFYIMKIDLCGSTMFLRKKSPQTYLKIAHTFLSSVDEITRYFGADANQAEYAGDSVIAYFRASDVEPEKVLYASYYCRYAAMEMQNLDATLKQYPFKTKTVLHFGNLIMAKIRPWGDGGISAIGFELHRVCKMEKDVNHGQGKATKEFWEKLKPISKKFLSANTITKQIPVEALPTPSTPLTFGLGSYANVYASASINHFSYQQGQGYEMKTEVVDYTVKWEKIREHLETNVGR